MTSVVPSQEKQAWYSLIVVAVTLAAYGVFIGFVRFDSVSLSVFALSGLLGVRVRRTQKADIEFDERDREIERRALLASLRVSFGALIVLTVVLNLAKGESYTVPLWTLLQVFWAGTLTMFGLKCALVIAAYRRGRDA